jgi:hypothetical protein
MKLGEGGRHKPGSVPPLPGGRLSIWDVCCQTPLAVLTAGPEKDQPCPLTLHPTGVYRASTSRCCWCALTAPLHPYLYRGQRFEQCPRPSAVCFCGTLLTVTRTGRYPASLVFREPGLSSDWQSPARNRLRYLPLKPSLSPRVKKAAPKTTNPRLDEPVGDLVRSL